MPLNTLHKYNFYRICKKFFCFVAQGFIRLDMSEFQEKHEACHMPTPML